MSSIFQGNEKFINFSLLFWYINTGKSISISIRFGGWLMSFSFPFRQSIQVFIVSPFFSNRNNGFIPFLLRLFIDTNGKHSKMNCSFSATYSCCTDNSHIYPLFFYHELELRVKLLKIIT